MKKASIDRIIEVMDKKGMYPEYYPGIAEMGYDDKEAIAANWWQRRSGELRTPLAYYIEKAFDGEIDTLWSDEWWRCCECNKAIRQSPDSYGWEPSYMWLSDCEIACHECIANSESLQEDAIFENL